MCRNKLTAARDSTNFRPLSCASNRGQTKSFHWSRAFYRIQRFSDKLLSVLIDTQNLQDTEFSSDKSMW